MEPGRGEPGVNPFRPPIHPLAGRIRNTMAGSNTLTFTDSSFDTDVLNSCAGTCRLLGRMVWTVPHDESDSRPGRDRLYLW